MSYGRSNVHVVCDISAKAADVYSSLKSLNFSGMTSFKLERCPNPPEPLEIITGIKTFRKVEIFDTDTFDLVTLNNITTERLKLAHVKNLTVAEGMIQMPAMKTLDINNIRNLTISGKPFQTLTNLKEIKIWRSKLEFVDEDIFHGLENVINIYLQDNSLGFLPRGIFGRLKDLQYLQLSNNSLRTLPADIFKSNKALKVVQLNNNCLLESLPSHLFSNQENMKRFFVKFLKCEDLQHEVNLANDLFSNPSIESVRLYFLRTETLPKYLLRGCGNLTKFVFQSGKLKEIDKDLFVPTKKIKFIDFANNQISNINKETFQGLSQLSSLRLHRNNLSEMSSDLFSGSPNVKNMELQLNRISSFDPKILTALSNLENINLSQNFLNKTIYEENSHLKKINLSKNKISKMDFDILTTMKNLEVIDMSNNELDDYLVVENNLNVTHNLLVNLSNNTIKGVKLLGAERSLSAESAVIRLQLGGNPLRCDCFATEIKRRDRNQNPRIDPLDFQCEGGLSLQETDYSQLACPAPPGLCPPGCECLVNDFLKTGSIKCQQGNMTSVPQYPASRDFSVALHLQGNQIEEVNSTALHWAEVVWLDLSDNKIERLQHHLLTEGLQHLSLDNNRIGDIPAATVSKLQERMASSNLSVRLGNNPLRCSCVNVRLLEFVQEHRGRILDLGNLTIDCHQPQDQLIFLQREDLCPPFQPELIIVGISVLIVAVVLVIFTYIYRDLIMIFVFSHSWGRYLFSEDLVDNTKDFDVFISFAQQDCQYVEDVLLPGLESPDQADQQLRCVVHTRDWLPGRSIPDQILHSVQASRRTLIVLSSSYVKSMWSNMEFQAAHVKTMEENIQVKRS